MHKRILFFGIFDPNYARNRVLIQGFEANGYSVEQCRTSKQGFAKYWDLFRKGHAYNRADFEYVIVAFPGHTVLWIAYLLYGGEVLFDAFLSQFDSNVKDRKLYGARSIQGIRDWLLDWYPCILARKVLLDTDAHIEFFKDTFNIPRSKFIRVFVGTTPDIFYPREEKERTEEFVVHFHGTYIPLHGIEYIIDAAEVLRNEPIQFQLVGDGGHLYSTIRSRVERTDLKNITFIPRVSLEELAEHIARADMCLGIFGNTGKAQRVIPNKVYEYAATGKPIVSAATPAMHELFVDGKNITLCMAADGSEIAESIRRLYSDETERQKLGQNAYELFLKYATPRVLVQKLLVVLAKN